MTPAWPSDGRLRGMAPSSASVCALGIFSSNTSQLMSRRRTGHFIGSGHVYPVMRLERGPDRIRLSVFVISKFQGLLPAFSPLAGGFEVSPSIHDRVFVVGQQQDVHEV